MLLMNDLSRVNCQPDEPLLRCHTFGNETDLFALAFQLFEFFCKLGSLGEQLKAQSIATTISVRYSLDGDHLPAHPVGYYAQRAQHRHQRRGTSSVHRQ